MVVKTVGELKEIIKDLPDEAPIVMYRSDMEKSGYQAKAGIRAENMVSERRETYDAFDYTPYHYEVFSPTHDDSGVPCLVID